MTRHACYFCDNESRFVCVRCKKDICKNHAHYERHQDGHGEWVCDDCHTKSVSWSLILGIIGVILIVVFIVVGIILFNNFSGDNLLP
jgi:hypothetical protein